MKSIIKNIFFGNYFYGFCVIALLIESTLQQELFFLHPTFYLFIFLGTVIYYTKAYIQLNYPQSNNPRVVWYTLNSKIIIKLQHINLFICLLLLLFYIYYLFFVKHISISLFIFNNFCLLLFPIAAAFYYGLSTKGIGKHNFRKIGWLKPIIIGFTWAGVVSMLPLALSATEANDLLKIPNASLLLFIKNMMFITTLAIMFDIKDYASDYNLELKTFVVQYGLRKTIFYILLPLSIIGMGSFLMVAQLKDFSTIKIILNTIPFLALLSVAYSMKKRRSILYYLVIIDGLILLKGICGSLSMLF